MRTRVKAFGFGSVLAAILVGIVMVGWAHDDANVIHACVNRSGDIRIISTGGSCTAREMPFEWNIQGPQGPAGPEGAAGPQGSPGPTGPGTLRVFDSVGTEVGTVIGSDKVARQVNGRAVALGVRPSGFETTSGFDVYFESFDCTGTPYLLLNENELLIRTVLVQNNIGYYAGDPIISSPPFHSSRGVFPNDEPSACFSFQSKALAFVGAVQTIDLSSLGLLPPFRAE